MSQQSLGFLPTRQFWDDPENKRLATVPVCIALWASFMAIFVVIDLLASPLWTAVFGFLAFMATVVIVHGLFERCIRQAAKRRFRARLRESTDAEQPATVGISAEPPSDTPDVRIG
jgi:hypothetical protein